MALLALAAAWARSAQGRPTVHTLTVDHGLREGSAAEAAGVVAAASALGLAARVLTWTGAKPETGIEAAAREARYRLLLSAAREVGASHLVTAHHLDDQAETFLMRLAHGSGPFGLSGMRRRADLGGVTLFRPFLGVGKARLIATAKAAGMPIVSDPMNADVRFERARWRKAMPMLAAEGLDARRLGLAAGRMGRVADALDHYADLLLARSVTVDDFALARLDRPAYAAEPVEVRIRVLGRLLSVLGGGRPYPPRLDHIEAVDAALIAEEGTGGAFRRTLARAVIDAPPGAEALLYREIGRAAPDLVAVAGSYRGVWDNRFAVKVNADGEALTLAPLGRDGLAASEFAGSGIPRAALMALPSLRRGSEILASPIAVQPAAAGYRFESRSILVERLLAA